MSKHAKGEYDKIIDRVHKFAHALEDDNDKRLVQVWIERLSEENKTSPARHNRNMYARYLEHQLRHEALRFPFTELPPKDELQPLAELVYGKKYKPKTTGRHFQTSSELAYKTEYERKPPKKKKPTEGGDADILRDVTLITVDSGSALKLLDMLEKLGPDVTLAQFVAMVSPLTEDKGVALQKIMHQQMDQYRTFAERMLQGRNRDFADLLFKQHAIKMEHYNARQERLCNELRSDYNRLFQLVPNWSWEKYKNDPNYIKEIFHPPKTADQTFLEHEAIENFIIWKEEVKQKLSLLQQLVTNLEKENQELTDILYVIRQTSYDRQTMDCLTGQLQYENNLGLYSQVKLLRTERDALAKSIEAFQKADGDYS